MWMDEEKKQQKECVRVCVVIFFELEYSMLVDFVLTPFIPHCVCVYIAFFLLLLLWLSSPIDSGV